MIELVMDGRVTEQVCINVVALNFSPRFHGPDWASEYPYCHGILYPVLAIRHVIAPRILLIVAHLDSSLVINVGTHPAVLACS